MRSGPETHFLIDPLTGTIRWVSGRITELAGWQPDDLIGERIQDLDEAIPSAEEVWFEATSNMPEGQVMTFDGRFRCAHGGTIAVEVRMTIMTEGTSRHLVAAARDVESRVRVEERLRERENTLTAAIGALTDGVVAVDKAGIVTLANPRAAELAGRPLHEILGRPLFDATSDQRDHHVWPLTGAKSPLLETLSTGKPVTGLIHEITMPESRWLLVNTSAIVDPLTGEGQGAVATSADITDLIEARAELEDMATLDTLTRLPNRGHFQKRLETALAASSVSGDHVALLFLDIDGFKTVNDSLGHSHGDELLQLAGVRLTEQLRPNDFIARIGGDEFVVLLPRLGPDMADAERNASEVAGRIVARMSEPFHLTARTVRISASVGIAFTPPLDTDAEGLLRQADLAMYAAKGSGRGAYRVFDHQMDAEAHRAMLLDGELRQAVDHGELAIYLQPRINVATGQLSGAEALLRWPSDRPDPVDTASIVATAERNGLILPIGRWVLEETIRLARQFYDLGVITPGMTISVNVSGHQLEREEFAGELAELIDAADLPAGIITVELTESSLVSDLFQARRRLRELESIGVPMAIDDFGTGYSSLAYLRDLPVRELKLDRMFISDLGRDPVAETIVEGVIGIAQKLGIDTIAEGVERPDQLEFLAAAGCDHYQGYLTSAALPPEDFMRRYGSVRQTI